MISSACLALPPRTTCWRSSGCHLAVPENSPLGDDDAVIVRLPAAAAPPPLHHDHDHHIIITLARSLASPTLPSLLLRPMIVELAFSHAALSLSALMRRHCYRSHCCSVFSRDPSVRPVWSSGVEWRPHSFRLAGRDRPTRRGRARKERGRETATFRPPPLPTAHPTLTHPCTSAAQGPNCEPPPSDGQRQGRGPTHRAPPSLPPKTNAPSLSEVQSPPLPLRVCAGGDEGSLPQPCEENSEDQHEHIVRRRVGELCDRGGD